MNKFKQWYVGNQDAITWFLIGFFIAQGLYELATRDYIWAVVSFGLAGVNYALRRVRLT